MNTSFKTKFIFFFAFVFLTFLSTKINAQLNGTKLIDLSGGGDYLSVSTAIADLNTQGVGAGGVIFSIKSGQDFNEPPMTITASGNETSPIVFTKYGVAENPKIYGINGSIAPGNVKETGDAIIKITGGDFITFTNINFYDSPLNTTAAQRMEYGILITRRDSDTNASKNISVTNCFFQMSLNNPYTAAIYNSNLKASGNSINPVFEDTDTNKRSINFNVQNNNISKCNFGIISIGIQDSPPYALYDRNVNISGNTINEIGGYYGVPCYGMDLRWFNEIKISGNSVSGGEGTTGEIGGINGIHTFAYDANSEISNNIVSVGSSTQNYNAIYGIYSGANGITKIHDNEVKNCYGNGQLFAPGGMMLINHYASGTNQLLIYNNNVHSNSSAGYSYYMNLISANTLQLDSCNIFNNEIHDNNSSSEGLASMSCIIGNNVHNNNIYNNSAAEGVTGIIANSPYTNRNSVYENNIYNNTNCIGISATGDIYRNNIYNLYTSENLNIVGIFINGGEANIYNNFISQFSAPLSNSQTAISGIYIRIEANVKVYFNTVYLNSYSLTATGGSAALFIQDSYSNSSTNIELKNNIFINTSVPGSNGVTAAILKTNTNLQGYSTGSNNNCFYVNTSSPRSYIYYNGTNYDNNINSFKARVSPAETNSFSEMPPFINSSSAPYNLHLRNDIVNKFESGGIPVTEPVNITNDFDGDLRNISTPDIGADEFNGMAIMRDAEISDIGFSGLSYFSSNAINSFTSKIKNNGVEHVSFKIYRNVSPGDYRDSIDVINLSPHTDTTIKFSDFTFVSGVQYSVKDSVYLSGDQISYNNSSTALFTPLQTKKYVILWGDTDNRDKLISSISADGRFTDFDTLNMNSYSGSLRPWRTVFALFGDNYNGLRTWTPRVRDSLKAFLDNSSSSNKKTLLIFGNDLGDYNDGNYPSMTDADSSFYHNYLKASYLQNSWGFNAEGFPYPFDQSEGRIRGVGFFSGITDDTANISFRYSDLLTAINGGEPALIPLTESGDGDSCVAIKYGGEETSFNVFYSSIAFNLFNNNFSSTEDNSIVDVFQAVVNWVTQPEIGGEQSLPVELASFSWSVNANTVNLKWVTTSEINNSGFAIERRKFLTGNQYTDWSKIGFEAGAGTTNDTKEYSFSDKNLASGKYSYRLKQIDYNGNYKYYNLNSDAILGIPFKFNLSQNYPNPFNPETKINFEIPFDTKVTLKIFDMLGREIQTLINGEVLAGYHTVKFNGANVSSGVYFYQIKAADYVNTKRMVFVK